MLKCCSLCPRGQNDRDMEIGFNFVGCKRKSYEHSINTTDSPPFLILLSDYEYYSELTSFPGPEQISFETLFINLLKVLLTFVVVNF